MYNASNIESMVSLEQVCPHTNSFFILCKYLGTCLLLLFALCEVIN